MRQKAHVNYFGCKIIKRCINSDYRVVNNQRPLETRKNVLSTTTSPITDEVRINIQRLNNNQSVGSDSFPAELLKADNTYFINEFD